MYGVLLQVRAGVNMATTQDRSAGGGSGWEAEQSSEVCGETLRGLHECLRSDGQRAAPHLLHGKKTRVAWFPTYLFASLKYSTVCLMSSVFLMLTRVTLNVMPSLKLKKKSHSGTWHWRFPDVSRPARRRTAAKRSYVFTEQVTSSEVVWRQCVNCRRSDVHLSSLTRRTITSSLVWKRLTHLLQRTLLLNKRSALFTLWRIAAGAAAWSSSWTSEGDAKQNNSEKQTEHHRRTSHITHSWRAFSSLETARDNCVRVLDLANFEQVCDVTVVESAVFALRIQTTSERNLLAAADVRSGIRVFDLERQKDGCLYEVSESSAILRRLFLNQWTPDGLLFQVPVAEIRNFDVIGDFVAVFHKFEPNISFWNMLEKKTILCIDIQVSRPSFNFLFLSVHCNSFSLILNALQEQMREMCDQFATSDDEMDDDVIADSDADAMEVGGDDHVTSVCSVATSSDRLLIYGTRSGCVFGLSLNLAAEVVQHSLPRSARSMERRCARRCQGPDVPARRKACGGVWPTGFDCSGLRTGRSSGQTASDQTLPSPHDDLILLPFAFPQISFRKLVSIVFSFHYLFIVHPLNVPWDSSSL